MGSGKDRNTFYLGYTMYSPYPGAQFFNFLEVCIVQVSGHAFQTSASGTLLSLLYVAHPSILTLWLVM